MPNKDGSDRHSSNSSVLDKARSFKADLKSRIIRRTPSITRSGSRSPRTSRKPKSSGLQRGNSFNEGHSKAERLAKAQETDVQKLSSVNKEVQKALGYMQDVLDKNILALLAGSVTVVLETIMELCQLIGSYMQNTDSTLLASQLGEVNQSLAALIRWSDTVILQEPMKANKQEGTEAINAAKAATEKLIALAVEKLENKSGGKGKGGKDKNGKHSSPNTLPLPDPQEKRSSLPDIPLTPREQKILSETKFGFEDEVDCSSPPPKPPLPKSFELDKKHRIMTDEVFSKSSGDQNGPAPPPLPRKKRQSSTASVYDNCTPPPLPSSSTSHNGDVIAGNNSPHHSPHSPNHQLLFQTPSVEIHSPASSVSPNSIHGSDYSPDELIAAGGGVMGHGLPNKFSNALGAAGTSTSFHQQSNAVATSSSSFQQQHHYQSTATAMSTASSSLSAFQQQAFSSAAARLSHYDNMQAMQTQSSMQSSQQTRVQTETSLKQFTQQMTALTNSVGEGMTRQMIRGNEMEKGNGDSTSVTNKPNLSLDLAGTKPPPLPEKKHDSTLSPTSALGLSPRSRQERQTLVASQYDNVLASIRNDPLVVSDKPILRTDRMRTSQSAMGFSSRTQSSFASATSATATGNGRRVTFQQQQQQQHLHCEQRGGDGVNSTASASSMFHQQHQSSSSVSSSQQHHMSSSVSAHAILSSTDYSNPPPLPEKKGKIDQYLAVGTFGEYTGPAQLLDQLMSRHSVTYYQSQFFQHQMEIFHPLYAHSAALSRMSDVSNRSSDVFSLTSASSEDSSGITTGSGGSNNATIAIMPALPAKQGHSSSSSSGGVTGVTGGGHSSSSSGMSELMDDPTSPASPKSAGHQQPDIVRCSTTPDKDSETNLLDALDVSEHLIKKVGSDGSWEIRGGCVDTLLVHATAAPANHSKTATGDQNSAKTSSRTAHFMYQEAFLTTYRTFITPCDLLDKLLYRYRTFSRAPDTKRKKLSRNAFSLLIRVVDELCMDVGEEVLQRLLELVLELVQDGELMLARILRRKGLEKIEAHKQNNQQHITLLSSYQLSSKQYKITDFKSEQIAEQMTLLDAMLFLEIEIPEVLLWAKEQNEEQSPNLTEFTEHFNKMSYWCRTQVLQQEEAKDREKVLIKFIKIMKHLRRLNNFNSYLAILSALDSAPLRRLEWQKQNLEALKEFCQLIDSSSSFRAYRQALAETEPPCIPYIGLILQDLTFVHIGNPDYLPEGKHIINFAKRWQQFHILDNMRRFKKCKYPFKRVQKIITFFNNFDDCLSEESLWQISENIKPRNTKKKAVAQQ